MLRAYLLRACVVPPQSADRGFTILELLISMVVMGVLAATAMPILANQSAKAHSVEAKNNLTAINRAQTAHYLEYGQFAQTLGQLDVTITPKAYRYAIVPTATGVIKHRAQPAPDAPPALKAYVSGVTSMHYSLRQLICESQHPRNHPNFATPNIEVQTGQMICLDSKPLG